MTIKLFILSLVSALMLSGCNQQSPMSSCSSPATQKVIASLLTEQTEKLTAEKKYDYYEGSFVFGGSKIRASLAQVQAALENIKTAEQDPDSSKVFCSGQLKVTIPAEMLADADWARDAQHQAKIAQYARQVNIENNANVFTQDLEYSVQPAGDGKELQVEFENAAWVRLLDEVTTSALLKPTLDVQDPQEIYHVQEAQQSTQEIEQLKPEAEPVKSDAEKIKALQEKQGLDRLNKELLEAEQVEKELAKERATRQVAPQSLPADVATKQASPSFNCAKATRATEITICTNAELAALDVENMRRYKAAKDIDAVATHEIWKESIKSKYNCGAHTDCIKEVYKKSISNYSCVAGDKESDCDAEAVPQQPRE